jgi:hypothetical protein
MSNAAQLCALCAIKPAVNREHAPARGLFPKPCPEGLNLITVPACNECNGGSKHNDEYLRSYFALRIEENPTDSLNRVREAATRAFTYPQGKGLRKLFARAMTHEWAPDDGGRVLTRHIRMTPDLDRVGRVLLKHTRAVFYQVTGRILPAGTKFLMMPDYKIAQLSDARQRSFQQWSEWASTGSCGQIGEVFNYALRVRDDDPNGFVLSLLYYRTFFYSVMTPSQSFKRGSMSDSWGHAANRLPGT